MECPQCKNPLSVQNASVCEWCGSDISNSNENIDNDILIQIKKNNMLAAVKLYKDRNNCSLFDAKQAIDKIKH
jgi:hypothetical protein